MDNEDAAWVELRKLREGRGLSADRLGNSPAVMSSLGASDPQIAYQRMIALIDEMGDGEKIRALRVDLALSLDSLLERKPASRELDWLGDRRSGYAKIIGRDVKTLARWSDAALAELRTLLINDTFTGELHIAVAVRDGRILGSTTIQEDGVSENKRISTDYPNASTEDSLPCLIYGYPRDWKPSTLTLIAAFQGRPPSKAYGLVAPNFFELIYATERYDLQMSDGMAICRFIKPRSDRLYALWWQW